MSTWTVFTAQIYYGKLLAYCRIVKLIRLFLKGVIYIRKIENSLSSVFSIFFSQVLSICIKQNENLCNFLWIWVMDSLLESQLENMIFLTSFLLTCLGNCFDSLIYTTIIFITDWICVLQKNNIRIIKFCQKNWPQLIYIDIKVVQLEFKNSDLKALNKHFYRKALYSLLY